MMEIITVLFQGLLAFFIGTVLFDIAHLLFHLFFESQYKWLKKIGDWHMVHHRFFSVTLTINQQWINKNLRNQVITEYFIHVIGILMCLLFLPLLTIVLALILETIIFIVVCLQRGMDFHHKPYTVLPSYRGGPFVTADYHALHHLHPTKFFSSYLKLLDYFLGSACYLKDKRIAMTGASGALGRHMLDLLTREGAQVTCFKFGVDYHYGDYEKLKTSLANTDILFLCHGSKEINAEEANCDSFIAIIELFRQVRKRTLEPLEIWGVGSEIECHPCFGIKKLYPYARSKRHFAKQARVYFYDKDIQYRHLVHSAFQSPMGPGLMSARFAAWMTLFLIKRGFKYVPVTYTGFAFLNYFRFVYFNVYRRFI